MVFKDLKIGEFFVFQEMFDHYNNWKLPCSLFKKVKENLYQRPNGTKVNVRENGLSEHEVTVIMVGIHMNGGKK
jgi:hypothetical protein